MSKFIIMCPRCGTYGQAETGFFARKKINCSCGKVIDVRTDKFTSRECGNCKNTVLFDQSLGDKAKCPVCQQAMNTPMANSRTESFSCSQCYTRLTVNENATTYTCPACACVNDVSKQLEIEKSHKTGESSVIKYAGNNETFAWKHPVCDFNFGTQLVVHESQEAIFFRDGQALDLFGSGRYTLETHHLPLIGNQLDGFNSNSFHSEVYFVNKAVQMGIKWGTDSKVRVFDPKSGLHVELGAGGQFNLRVTDSRKLLLKIVGTTNEMVRESLLGNGEDKSFFRAMVMTNVKTLLAQTIKDQSINILEIDAKLMELSTGLQIKINEGLANYGLEMPEFFVSRVMTPDDDPNFRQLKEQFAAEYLLVREEEIKEKEALAAARRKSVEAETAARLKIIEAQGDAEAYKLKAEAEAREMQLKGYTYQQETARQVGLEAMQNGITGGGAGSGIGEIAGLGVTLGAMGGVMNLTRDALNPILGAGSDIGAGVTNVPNDSWKCSCGHEVTSGNFCNSCGQPKQEAWDCSCGNKGVNGNFCNVCGNQKAVTWDCTCGNKNIVGGFCNNCGKARV